MTVRQRMITLMLLGSVVFSVPIFFRDLWTPDEPRYALIAQEMIWSGDYLVPRRNGEPYREKPPLLFWAMAASSLPLGHVSESTARIPSVLAALATLALTFELARRMYDDRIALLAGLILATGFRFWWQAQNGQIDMLLCACTTLSLYALYRWHETRLTVWLVLLYVGMALGLLAKGPPAVLFPVLAVIGFYWGNSTGRRALRLWIGVPAAIGVTMLWFIPARSAVAPGNGFGSEIGSTIYHQVIERIFLGAAHARPPWYYLENLPIDWFPWTIFLPWVLVYTWRHRKEGDSMRLLLAWTVPALVFFTLSTGKRSLYLVPLYPVFAILTARAALAISESGRRRWLLPISVAWMGFTIAIGAVPLVLRATPFAEALTPRTLLVPLVAAVVLVWTIRLVSMRAWRHLPWVIAYQMAALILASVVGIFPLLNQFKTSKPFCEPVRALVRSGDVEVFAACFVRDEYVFYSETLHRPLLLQPGRGVLEPHFGADEGAYVARQLRRSLVEAAARVIDSEYTYLADEQARLIREEFANAARETGVPSRLVDQWAEDVKAEIANMEAVFLGDTPSILFVDIENWRWIKSFIDDKSAFFVIRNERVTSRNMMLIGNDAAVRKFRLQDTTKLSFPDPITEGGNR